jgi:ribosome-interacting GTPase 1
VRAFPPFCISPFTLKSFPKMASAVQKIAEIEHEMSRTQKNKATNQHLGILKAKLAKLKAEVLMGDKTAGGRRL